ncbi:hypothetical protein MFMK1_003579 [Metallumcola ferriviriculae]|uniref:Uncharacterized protein n=1 Tax=Metallumcola ferriviriculae TaxID=3039180 RepID=A0AAU0URT8_9FIRM|nr:hypothetical protein MFMK1_003579 [Desulfitibacteraceae bacterium MK1]
MSRRKKVIRNFIILGILFVIFLNRSGLYLTPLSAHEHSERSIHYGPSEVVHIEDFDGGKYILGKYDKWVSANTVNRTLFFFWRFGSQPIGFENDKSKAVDYTWSSSYENYKLYGIVNDDKVKKVEIILNSGESFAQKDFYDDLFLFTWQSKGNENMYFKSIRGYDSENKVIFEEKH